MAAFACSLAPTVTNQTSPWTKATFSTSPTFWTQTRLCVRSNRWAEPWQTAWWPWYWAEQWSIRAWWPCVMNWYWDLGGPWRINNTDTTASLALWAGQVLRLPAVVVRGFALFCLVLEAWSAFHTSITRTSSSLRFLTYVLLALKSPYRNSCLRESRLIKQGTMSKVLW